MKKEILLSICIPTYNRKNFLKEALDSINSQESIDSFFDEIEIVISDNASQDGTKEFIKKYKSKVNIVYDMSETNLGPDRNYLRVISLAKGKYCWILGSDDCIVTNGINRIISEIKKSKELCDIYICNRYECDFKTMKPFDKAYWLDKNIKDTVFDFTNRLELSYYFNHCNSLGGVFSYLSSLIVNREEWNKVDFEEAFIGSGYAHTYILLYLIYKKQCKLKYIRQQLILNRNGNDSFLKNPYQRFMLDINGYIQLSEIFTDYNLKNDFLKILRKEHTFNKVINYLILCKYNEFISLKKALLIIGYDKNEIKMIDSLRNHRISVFYILLDRYGFKGSFKRIFKYIILNIKKYLK